MSAEEDRLRHIPQEPVHLVPVDALSVDACPRLSGEDPDHLRILLETPNELPPILVHRPTMRVIDGMHRLSVARLRGQSQIAVRYFDGAEEDAFVLSVQNNVRHGLPLSLADRTAAATRIARSHPHWSDRTIARTSGLSPKTVAAIRRRSSAEIPPRTPASAKTDGVVPSTQAKAAAVPATSSPPTPPCLFARSPRKPASPWAPPTT